jgi:hypothetical protein
MNRLTNLAEECNLIPTANNAAFDESILDENVSSRSGDEQEVQLREADKCNAKIHYFSRTIAVKHGIIAATMLSGLAYKLKYHRLNKWKDRWWYFDSIETLRTRRWPYLSVGCISETGDYLANEKLLIKDCNNKASYDRTIWYSMDDNVRKEALSDLIWFDVGAAKKFRNILPGIIYHNLRYHLRKELEKDPQTKVPYHHLNQALLARLLMVNVSTVKSWVKKLKEKGYVSQHAKKLSLYTIADEREYRPIVGSANDGSMNAIDGSVNVIDGSANAIVGSANDYTQYETSKKPFINQSETGVCDTNSSHVKINDSLQNDDDIIHQLTPDKDLDHNDNSVRSFLPGSKENTKTFRNDNIYLSTSFAFEQLIQQTKAGKELLDSLDEDKKSNICDSYTGICSYFVENQLPATIIQQLWNISNRDQLVKELQKSFADFTAEDIPAYECLELSKDQLWQLFYFPHLETLVRAFLTDKMHPTKEEHTMPVLRKEINDTCWSLGEKLRNEANFSSDIKCSLFKQTLAIFNCHGWIMRDDTRRMNAVQPTASGLKKIKTIFEENPNISTRQLFDVLNECVDVSYMEEVPSGFDKYWATRQGRHLDKFAQFLEKIIKELEIFEECPIQNFPERKT